jgi:mono/diheme cytochrome c family protein
MRTMMWRLLLTVSVVSVVMAAGNATTGKAAYDKACKGCHGADGTPNAAIAKAMKVQMVPLGDPEVQKLSDEELSTITTNGKGKMKAIKTVSGKTADDVVAYLRSLKK